MRNCRLSLPMVMFLGLFGCGGAPVASDPASARSVLETVLESWKRGDSPQALRDGTPPLNVADYRWEGKYKLNAYSIAESATAAGFDQRFSVELRLTTPRGKASREKAVYHVATSPAIAVVRDPES